MLADGVFGRVRTQTPEVVVVESFEAVRSYPTAEFLKQAPRNLSRGFVVDATFHVGLEHRNEVTTTLREQLERAIVDAVAATVPTERVRKVSVEFNGMQPTGFELLAMAECDGTLAGDYWPIRRAMQAAFVRASQQHDWQPPTALVIPPRNPR